MDVFPPSQPPGRHPPPSRRPFHARLPGGPFSVTPPRAEMTCSGPSPSRDVSQDKLVQNRNSLACRVSGPRRLSGAIQARPWATDAPLPLATVLSSGLAETARAAKRPDVVGPSVSRLTLRDDGCMPGGLIPTPGSRSLEPIARNRSSTACPPSAMCTVPLHPLTDADGKPSPAAAERSRPSSGAGTRTPSGLPRQPAPGRPPGASSAAGGSPGNSSGSPALINAQAGGGGSGAAPRQAEWINLGPASSTGSASLFMGMAIGVMGSYIDGGGSAAISLPQPREASLVFIQPRHDKPASLGSCPPRRPRPAQLSVDGRSPADERGIISIRVGRCSPTGGAASHSRARTERTGLRSGALASATASLAQYLLARLRQPATPEGSLRH